VKIDKSGFLQACALLLAQLRRSAAEVEFDIPLLVIHTSACAAQLCGSGVIDFFTNQLDIWQHPYYEMIAISRFSPFFHPREGEVIQFVSCNKRAWHAAFRAGTTVFAATTFPSVSSWKQ